MHGLSAWRRAFAARDGSLRHFKATHSMLRARTIWLVCCFRSGAPPWAPEVELVELVRHATCSIVAQTVHLSI